MATAGDIARVALIRAGSVTHGFHMDQRYIGLEIVSAAAPPGAYFLFLLDAAGVPSVGHIVKIG